MKKYLLIIILYFNLLPLLKDGHLGLQFSTQANAQTSGTEDEECNRVDEPLLVETKDCTEDWVTLTHYFYCKEEPGGGRKISRPPTMDHNYVPSKAPECQDDGGTGGGMEADCNGDIGGMAYMAECGCIGGNTGIWDCPEVDCNGDPDGWAYLADCGCIGGNTGIYECPQEVDCNGDPGGTAYWADCGCIGGNTGITECCPPCPEQTSSISSIKPGKGMGMSTMSSFGNCECQLPPDPGVRVNLSISNTTLQPGQSVQMSSSFSSSAPVTDVAYRYLGRIGTTTKVIAGEEASTCAYTLIVLGEVYFKAEVGFSYNGEYKWVSSDEVAVSSKFYLSEFLCNYSGNMTAAWASTLNATANGTEKREDGFIVDLLQGGGFALCSYFSSDPCSALKPSSTQTMYSNLPAGYNIKDGARLTIGDFHTHPPLTNCSDQHRVGGASGPDLEGVRKWPWVVHDYEGTIYGGDPANKPSKDYTYGDSTTY